MNALERLSQELKAAMLAKDADRLSTLRLLKSALGYAQIERKTPIGLTAAAGYVASEGARVKRRRQP